VATTAVLLSGASARAADNLVSLPDPAGDAHAATPLCAVDCSGLPTPASEPSIDVRTARVDRVGGDLVYEWKVVDLDHVPLAQPEDTVGYDLSLDIEGVSVTVVAQRTAAHAPLPAKVIVGDRAGSSSTRPVTASFDHGGNAVRATVPLAVLNDAVDDVCASCHVDNGSQFEHPFAMTYLLGTTPLGPTGPMYQDLVRQGQGNPIVPTEDGLPNWYLGGGPFSGTITYHALSAECGDWGVPTTMSLTANVVLSKGTGHYAGPLAIEGSGCGEAGGTVALSHVSMRGTDLQGRTLDCPDMSGLVLDVLWWGGSMAGPCTLDGTPLSANPVPWGKYVPTGIDTDLNESYGTVVGFMTVSARGA
jgi:hypothetical protein